MKSLLSKPFRPPGRNPIWARFQPPAPAEWVQKRVADLGSTMKGRLPRELSTTSSEGAKPYYLIEGLLTGNPQGYTSESNLPECIPTDTVVVADGSRSGLAIMGRSGILGSTLLAVRAKERTDNTFLFYLIESLYEFLNKAPTGGAIPHLDQDLLARFVVSVPADPAEQARIAGTLKAADDHIRALEDQIRKAERVKKALLQSYPSVPKHGHGTSLFQRADISAGFTKGRDLAGYETMTVAYLTVVNVLDGALDLSNVSDAEIKKSELEGLRLLPGDVLMTEGGDRDKLGRGCIWQGQIDPIVCQNHIFRVRPDAATLKPWFLHYLLQTPNAKRYFYSAAKQTSNLCTINSRDLRRFPLPDIETSEQDAWIERIQSADQLISAIQAQLAAARRVKQSLLQNLLTGRIRLKPGVGAGPSDGADRADGSDGGGTP